MQQIQIDVSKFPPALCCSTCKGTMRLVGSEPHPTKDGMDLLTYTCTVCEELEVVPVPVAGPAAA